MLKYILLLSLLGLSHGRPKYGDLHEPHEDCPDDRHLLLPHEYDCTKFYYCEYGLKRIDSTDCAPGTEFSTELQVCVDPITANCTLPGFTTTENPTEEIENGTQSTSGPTTTTVSTTNSTDAPINTTTIVPSTITTVAPTTNLTEAPINTTTVAPTTVTTVAPTTNLTEAPINSTTAEPTTITTIAPTTNLTEAPINTTTVAPTTITTEAPTTNSTEAPVNATTVAPTTTEIPTTQADELEYLDNGCPADFDVHKLLPHETSCDKFYYCVRGELVERNCSTGTYFNPVIQVCDWPQNVNCTNEGDYEEDEDDVVEGGSPDSEEEDEAPEEGALLPNGCPADFDVHKLIPHETDCDKYYYCVFGDLVERTCSPGTHFNYEIQVCDWPQNVNCTLGGNGNGTVNPDGNDNSTESPGGDSGSGDNGDEDSDALLPNGCPVDYDVHQLLPHETDCNKFYYCVAGEKIETQCANDTHFNPELKVCDWPWNAGCEIGEGSGDGDDNGTGDGDSGNGDNGDGDNGDGDNGNGDNGNGDNGDGDNGNGDNGTGDSGNGDNGDGDNGEGDNGNGDSGTGNGDNNGNGDGDNGVTNKCEGKCNVLPWKHETDCDKYWICDGNTPTLIVCSEGLHFNPNTYSCDFICNANCVREDIQSTPGVDGVKLFLPWDKIDSTSLKYLLNKIQH